MSARLARANFSTVEPRSVRSTVVPSVADLELGSVLSDREEEIARLAVRGYSNKEIGQLLGISPWTVATHLRRTFLKLDITRRIELCAIVGAVCGKTSSWVAP